MRHLWTVPAILLCASAAFASGDARTHDGFFLRLQGGPGWMRASNGDDDVALKGGGGAFNFEIGADAQKIRVGDARTAEGELEVRVGGCDGPVVTAQPLPAMPAGKLTNTLRAVALPAQPGRHDVCLRFARPKLDPMWALDWVEIRP